MSLIKSHKPSASNHHSNANQSFVQQTVLQRGQNDNQKDNQTEQESAKDVQLKTSPFGASPLKGEPFVRQTVFGQAKLNIGKANDKYEVEADRVADKVVSKNNAPAPPVQKKDAGGPKESEGAKEEDVQMKSAPEQETEIQEKPISESISTGIQLKPIAPTEDAEVQKMEAEPEGEAEVQTKLDASTEAPENIQKAEAPAEESDLQKTSIQTKCSSCGKTESAEKLNVQQKCASCEGEAEVQTKLDASTEAPENIQKAEAPAEESDLQKTAIQTKCSSCGKTESAEKLNVQQKCASCEGEEKSVQKKEADPEGEAEVQTKSDSASNSGADVESSLKSSKGKGSSMDDNTRSSMESGFGADFSGVRIHTDSNAVQMNKSLGSQAFANGSDVYFNEGKYNPSSNSGQHLLAHELTHTVQQGASPKAVQQKEENATTSKEETKEEPKIQQMNANSVQMAEDPCADAEDANKDKAGGAKEEESQATKDCKTRHIPAEDPGDRDEPDQEETTKDIEAKPKMSAEERQKGAPPVDGDPKAAEEPAGENPLEICKAREEKAAEQGNPQGAAAAGALAGAAGEKGEAGAAAGGAVAGAAGPADKAAGGDDGGKKKGKKAKSLAEAVEQAAAEKGPIAPAQGEMSSPAEVAKRQQNIAATMEATAGVNGILGRIQGLGSSVIGFSSETGESTAAVDGMANAFLLNNANNASSLIQSGMAQVDNVKAETANKRRSIQANIASRKLKSKAFFRSKKKQATLSALKAKMALNEQHQATVLQIQTKASTDIQLLRDQFKIMSKEINLKYLAQVVDINTIYSKSYWEHIKIGKDSGKKAKQTGYDMAVDYRSATNEGATSYDRDHVKNQKKDGFWDGYLTYNRYMARADSAKETGKQYAEGMEEQGKEKATKLNCEKKLQLDVAKELMTQGILNLQCALDDAVDSIQLRKTATLGQATAAKEEFTRNLDAGLKGTLAELNEKEVTQNLLINDYGYRQIVALENMSLVATTGLLKGIQGLAEDLYAQLDGFVTAVQGNEAPDVATYQEELNMAQAQFDAGLQATKGGIDTAESNALGIVNEGYTKGLEAIKGIYDQGIQDGNELFGIFNDLITGIDAERTSFYTLHLQTSIEGLQMDYDQGLSRMTSVVTMIGIAYEHILNGLKENLTASEKGLLEGMNKTINEDLKFKICSEAEKAAEEVQPWWKSVLKVLLVILVIVIVIALTVVTAGAFAAVGGAIAGTLGLGAVAGTIIAGAIAGAVMGALSSLLITVGMNVINLAGTGKLTWSGAFEGALDAVIQGAIAGAIGGMAGPIVGVMSKGIGVVGKVLIEEGIEIVFDVVGGIIGDLVLYGEVKDWGNIVFGAVVARGIANGVKIVPKIKTKITGAKGDVDVDVNTGKPKIDADPNAPKVDAEAPTVKNGETGTVKSGDGPTTKIDEPDPPGTIRDANGRLRDAKTKRFVKDPNSKTSTKKVDGEGSSPKKNEVDSGSGKKVDEDGSAPKKKMGDEQDLETTRSKDTLSEKEYELEKNAMEARRPGKKVDMEDNGVKYNEEVELPNGHKWRKRLDGGWCRFSKKSCFPSGELTVGQKQANDAGWPPSEKLPDGYEYYSRPGDTPGIRNKPGFKNEAITYDKSAGKFVPDPKAVQKPRFETVEQNKTKLSHDEFDDVTFKDADGNDVTFKDKQKQHAENRKSHQKNKEGASDDVKSQEHGKMVSESETLGDTATEAVIKKKFAGATDLDHSLPGNQKSGEFDRIIKNGDEVIIIESKGAGSQRGSRQIDAEGTRAEQGTPEYRESIVKNMEDTVAKHKLSDRYNTDDAFKKQVDSLQDTIDELRIAELSGNLKYMQVTQKVGADGIVKPEVEIITFGNSSTDLGTP